MFAIISMPEIMLYGRNQRMKLFEGDNWDDRKVLKLCDMLRGSGSIISMMTFPPPTIDSHLSRQIDTILSGGGWVG